MEGFVQLHPDFAFKSACPHCGKLAAGRDWFIPGPWTTAQCHCESCDADFLMDLPYALGVVMPCVLDVKTGKAQSLFSGNWFATWTAAAWNGRSQREVAVKVERHAYGRKICLINTLYPCWGDAANLLLRVNRLKSITGVDVVVIINASLRWLVPDFVRGVWVVEQGVLDNWNWNEIIDRKIKAIIREENLTVLLPATFQPAHLTAAELYAVCKIPPFPVEQWTEQWREKPVVTFMLRRDRTWGQSGSRKAWTLFRRVCHRVQRAVPRWSQGFINWQANAEQMRNLRCLAAELREILPNIELAVCGVGKQGRLAPWVKDLRTDRITADTNRTWAEQAARSHVFVGVHGSHTSLFASLAGSCIELTPNDRLKNILQCSPVTSREPREALYRNRFLPGNTDPCYLADTICGIIINFPYSHIAYGDRFDHPLSAEELASIRERLAERMSVLQSVNQKYLDLLAN